METLISVFLTTAATIVGNILSKDVEASADRWCTGMLRRAAAKLDERDRAGRQEEWLAHSQELATTSEKFAHALGCLLAARAMRRASRRVTIALTFNVARVGNVPLSFTLGPTWAISMMASAMRGPAFVKLPAAATIVGYMALKLGVNVAKLGEGSRKAFQRDMINFRQWGYSARIIHRGSEVDISSIVETMVKHPAHVHEIIDYLQAQLSHESNSRDPSAD